MRVRAVRSAPPPFSVGRRNRTRVGVSASADVLPLRAGGASHESGIQRLELANRDFPREVLANPAASPRPKCGGVLRTSAELTDRICKHRDIAGWAQDAALSVLPPLWDPPHPRRAKPPTPRHGSHNPQAH